MDKLSKSGLIIDNKQIKNSPNDIVNIINNLRKHGTYTKISKNYKLDMYSTVKALYR